MTPGELCHFADRISMIGVYEGPAGFGIAVRLDDGTPAIVFGECVDDCADDFADEQYLTWTDADVRFMQAVHDHSDDTLRWRDERGFHVESCALART